MFSQKQIREGEEFVKKTTNEIIESKGFIGEAPNDGKTYGRKSENWAEITGGFTIPDAPSDDELYSRKNGSWVSTNLHGDGRTIKLGSGAGEGSGGVGSVYLGFRAGIYATGNTNVVIGQQYQANTGNNIGAGNVMIGDGVQENIQTGSSENILLGRLAGYADAAVSFNGALILGHSYIGTPIVSNEFRVGVANTGQYTGQKTGLLLHGNMTSGSRFLNVNGKFGIGSKTGTSLQSPLYTFPEIAGTAGQILKLGSDGKTLEWADLT